MPKFKIVDDYPGFEIGQIVEFNSPFRIAQMKGDEFTPPKGVLVLDKPKVNEVRRVIKKGVNNEDSINRGLDGTVKRGTIRPKRINGTPTAVKKSGGKTKAKKVSR